jgi:type IV pilus biogenesis protein CpaD/CtpE
VKLKAIPLVMAVAAAGLLTACASPQVKATDLAATQQNAQPIYTTAVVVNSRSARRASP